LVYPHHAGTVAAPLLWTDVQNTAMVRVFGAIRECPSHRRQILRTGGDEAYVPDREIRR